MTSKTIIGITLTLLLIGMLTLTSNIQSVRSDPETWRREYDAYSLTKSALKYTDRSGGLFNFQVHAWEEKGSGEVVVKEVDQYIEGSYKVKLEIISPKEGTEIYVHARRHTFEPPLEIKVKITNLGNNILRLNSTLKLSLTLEPLELEGGVGIWHNDDLILGPKEFYEESYTAVWHLIGRNGGEPQLGVHTLRLALLEYIGLNPEGVRSWAYIETTSISLILLAYGTPELFNELDYSKLAEGRAEAYARYAEAVHYYTAEQTLHFSTQLVRDSFSGLLPIFWDLLQLELADNILETTKVTYDVITDFKGYLDGLTDPLIEVFNRFVYGAQASQTYNYLRSLEELCRKEADAWRSYDLNRVESILADEAEAIVPPLGAIPYALGFRLKADGIDDNAFKVADATLSFLSQETKEIANLKSVVKQMSSIVASLHSPGDLHAYDEQGRHTGAIYDDSGNVVDIEVGIPESIYTGPELEPESIALLNTAKNSYVIEVVGKDVEEPRDFSLDIHSFDTLGNLVMQKTYQGSIQAETKITYAVEVTATGEFSEEPFPGPSGIDPLMIGVVAILIIAVGAAAVLLLRRRR